MRLLVVEDEKRLAAGLRKGLVSEGFSVDVALHGSEGLAMARAHAYDLILLDLMLPGTNGYRICSTLRSEGDWTPILMLTAKDGELDEAEALDGGADDYLTKPFSHVVLVARLRALLRRRTGERPGSLHAAGLTLDLAAKRCWCGEAEVKLTAREMEMLEFLIRHEGTVVSKREILDSVWDFDFEGDPNIVEVYVKRLRGKVDRPFDKTTIETVRGFGYRLAADDA